MKKLSVIIFLILLYCEVKSQAVSSVSNSITISKTELKSEKIRKQVEVKFNEWLNTKLNSMESSSAYAARVGDLEMQRKVKENLLSEAIIEIGKIDQDLNNPSFDYDDENQTMKIKFGKLEPIYVHIPNDELESFVSNSENIGKQNPKMGIKGENFYIKSITISNPINGLEYHYDIKNSAQIKYQNITVNSDISTDELMNSITSTNQVKTETKSVGNSDIDIEIPNGKKRFNNGIAILIGNKNYKAVPGVEFAHNDVNTMKNYLINSLGFEKENIILELDATKGTFNKLFDSDGQLANRVSSNTTVFIYYSGHGVPGNNDAKQYFMPVDADPNYVEKTAYSFNEFYDNLSKLKTKEVVVAVDACFSGSGLIDESKRPGMMRLEQAQNRPSNTLVFAASSSKETSLSDKEKKHGLFTYYLLKAIKDKYNSDMNKDGKLTAFEIFQYMKDEQKGIPYRARVLDNKQTPELNGSEELKSLVLFEY